MKEMKIILLYLLIMLCTFFILSIFIIFKIQFQEKIYQNIFDTLLIVYVNLPL